MWSSRSRGTALRGVEACGRVDRPSPENRPPALPAGSRPVAPGVSSWFRVGASVGHLPPGYIRPREGQRFTDPRCAPTLDGPESPIGR